MIADFTHATWRTACGSLTVLMCCFSANLAEAQLVPGTGRLVEEVGDDFEDPDWDFIPRLPKSSRNIDKQGRYPVGESSNGRWVESSYRGHPDVLRRVPTPPGGLPGSQGSLLMRTLESGVPRVTTRESQQDDLLLNVSSRIGGYIPPSRSPSVVVRVFLPPFEQWDNSTDTSLGIRTDCKGWMWQEEKHRGLFRVTTRRERKFESYWPGFFIQFNSETDPGIDEDSALLIIRADQYGRDMVGPKITQTGWWTFGMSITPDSRVHYYASPGVDDLTPSDHITSQIPYGAKCERFYTFFFNVVSRNDGRHWSTDWIIDDPRVYVRN